MPASIGGGCGEDIDIISLKKLYRIFNDAVFPPRCLVCGAFFQPPEAARGGPAAPIVRKVTFAQWAAGLLTDYLCSHCSRGLVAVESPLCSCCGLPFESRHGMDHPCDDCRMSPKKFRIARAPLIYEKILARVIHCYKYKSKIQLARPLGNLLWSAFEHFWDPDSIDIILPVPLHGKRLRQRGFNQAYLLLHAWQTIADWVRLDSGPIPIERDILIRTVPTPSQTGLGRQDRAVNIRNAFELTDKKRIIGKRVLLVDDIYTTGATVNECARLLTARGAEYVDVLCLARAV